jgi:SAM-dependent methyltransferase
MRRKQPKLVLRESCVDDVSKTWEPGNFLEMGAGTGRMTRIFLERGFWGACYDLGDDSRQMIRANLDDFRSRITVVDDVTTLSTCSFDFLLAFEVLEHIEDDAAAMKQWTQYLKPGGKLLISVPAHSRKYGRSDEIVGHIRRYEKQELLSLLERSGFDDIRIVNYGFPITELTRRVSNFLIRGDRTYDDLSPTQRSIRSAQAKPKIINRLLTIFSGKLVSPFCAVQRWFYRRDWGDGYVATAIKRGG